MIRIQIRLDRSEYELVKRESAALGISIAEFLRRAVREKLPAAERAPWMRYAGFVESGDSRSGHSIDDSVCGSKG